MSPRSSRTSFRGTVVVLLLAFAGVLLWPGSTRGVFLDAALQGGQLQAAPPTPSARPTWTQCARLYRHQLRIMSGDENPIAPALRKARRGLQGRAVRDHQIAHCRRSVSRAGLLCQMRARTIHALISCGQAVKRGDRKQPEKKPEKKPVDKPTDKKIVPKQLIRRVTDKTCGRAYEHMLKLYAASATFQKRKDASRLMRHWQSAPARRSFAVRCRRRFGARDLNCMLGTRDTVVLQACLVRVGH